ncbi:MAG: hypothetical protein DRQ46_00520 [Gammaproteobacteria bacterium]|nr:MAG: hypothetical protein DRQ46_00520 [Gammaproteobacteria bacterium]
MVIANIPTTGIYGDDIATPINSNFTELAEKNGVFAYLASPTATTVTTGGTYYTIAGTFTNAPMENFSLGTGIDYDGLTTKYFEVDWHATVSGDSNSITCSVGIKKNTSVVTSSIMGTLLKTSGESYVLSGTTVVELATNDAILLVLTADGDGDVITVEHFTTTIRPFFY